jgi:hypothetical protein
MGGDQLAEFTDAPWLAWQRLRGAADAPSGALAVIEHTPFRMDWGDRIGSASLADLSGMLGVGLADLATLAGRGYLGWDCEARMAIACVPIDRG